MPLTHHARLELAYSLVAQFTERNRTIIAGLYGSTASGSDTLWSDLELLFVVEEGETCQSIAALFSNTVVSARVITVSSLEHQAKHPDQDWPMLMGILDAMLVLYGDRACVEAWLSLGENVPEQTFREALVCLAPTLVFESCGRIQSCRIRDDSNELGAAILETLLEMGTLLCLLNRSWVHHGYYQGLLETLRFPLLPRRYALLLPALWHASKPAEAAPLAEALLEDYVALLREQGVLPTDWSTIEPSNWPL